MTDKPKKHGFPPGMVVVPGRAEPSVGKMTLVSLLGRDPEFVSPEEFTDNLRRLGVPIPEGCVAWAYSHKTTLGEEDK